jgi:hypothetical protein
MSSKTFSSVGTELSSGACMARRASSRFGYRKINPATAPACRSTGSGWKCRPRRCARESNDCHPTYVSAVIAHYLRIKFVKRAANRRPRTRKKRGQPGRAPNHDTENAQSAFALPRSARNLVRVCSTPSAHAWSRRHRHRLPELECPGAPHQNKQQYGPEASRYRRDVMSVAIV